jgi:hypothetical protein
MSPSDSADFQVENPNFDFAPLQTYDMRADFFDNNRANVAWSRDIQRPADTLIWKAAPVQPPPKPKVVKTKPETKTEPAQVPDSTVAKTDIVPAQDHQGPLSGKKWWEEEDQPPPVAAGSTKTKAQTKPLLPVQDPADVSLQTFTYSPGNAYPANAKQNDYYQKFLQDMVNGETGKLQYTRAKSGSLDAVSAAECPTMPC